MDRRIFCLGSAAAAVCRPDGSAFAGASSGRAIALDRVVFDSRYAECRSFAAAARRCGHEPIAFDGDVTPLWHELRRQWAAGVAGIAGMTSPPSLFCLEQLAKDHWRRVVIRIEHRRSPAGIANHRVTATLPMLTRTGAALDTPAWPSRVPAWPSH